MASYQRGFDFNTGDLGYNLATFQHDADRYIQRAKEEAAVRGETALKLEAPWSDRTGNARRGLWAEPYGDAERGGLRMGHSAEYGVYLEESNGGKFQVIMPVLLKTARALMESMMAMFLEMDSPSAVPPVVIPAEGGRRGTSQTPERRAKRIYHRDERGRFVSIKSAVRTVAKGVSSRTKRTRRR